MHVRVENYCNIMCWEGKNKLCQSKYFEFKSISRKKRKLIPGDFGGAGGTNGGGGDNGGAPGQGLDVPGPHRRGLLAKLQNFSNLFRKREHVTIRKIQLPDKSKNHNKRT